MNRRNFIGRAVAATAAVAAPNILTLQAASGATPLQVLFLTDVHAMAEHDVPNRLTQTAVAINRLRPDLILGGGDYVHGGFKSTAAEMEARWSLFNKFRRKLSGRFEPMIGNHDFVEPITAEGTKGKGDPRRFFLKNFSLSQTYRSFKLGGYRFILLDTVEITADGSPFPYRGHINDKQLSWLEVELRAIAPTEPIVLMGHIPFRTTFLQAKSGPLEPPVRSLFTGNANECLTLFKNHSLRFVLQGHLHYNEHIVVNDLHFIMGGAVCGQWWQGSNLGTAPGFGLLDLEKSSWEYQS